MKGNGLAAQEKPSEFEAAIIQAQRLQVNKEYAKAVPLYLKGLEYPEAEQYRWMIHYNIGSCYALLRDSERALGHIE